MRIKQGVTDRLEYYDRNAKTITVRSTETPVVSGDNVVGLPYTVPSNRKAFVYGISIISVASVSLASPDNDKYGYELIRSGELAELVYCEGSVVINSNDTHNFGLSASIVLNEGDSITPLHYKDSAGVSVNLESSITVIEFDE